MVLSQGIDIYGKKKRLEKCTSWAIRWVPAILTGTTAYGAAVAGHSAVASDFGGLPPEEFPFGSTPERIAQQALHRNLHLRCWNLTCIERSIA
jgi:hypothetical protein